MQGLITINASFCNLGLNEKYDDSLENDGRNPETDSLSFLEGKKDLQTVSVYGNHNLKWINYISDLNSTLYGFDADKCESLVGTSVRDIKDIILTSKTWTILEKYYVYLSSDDRIDLLNMNLTDSSDNFLALKDNLELKGLRLDR